MNYVPEISIERKISCFATGGVGGGLQNDTTCVSVAMMEFSFYVQIHCDTVKILNNGEKVATFSFPVDKK